MRPGRATGTGQLLPSAVVALMVGWADFCFAEAARTAATRIARIIRRRIPLSGSRDTGDFSTTCAPEEDAKWD